MPIISQQSFERFVFVINGSNLLTIFQRVFKEPVKVVHLQKLTNQGRLNGALVMGKINSFLCKNNTKFGRIPKKKRSNKVKEILGCENSCTERQSCLYLIRF